VVDEKKKETKESTVESISDVAAEKKLMGGKVLVVETDGTESEKEGTKRRLPDKRSTSSSQRIVPHLRRGLARRKSLAPTATKVIGERAEREFDQAAATPKWQHEKKCLSANALEKKMKERGIKSKGDGYPEFRDHPTT